VLQGWCHWSSNCGPSASTLKAQPSLVSVPEKNFYFNYLKHKTNTVMLSMQLSLNIDTQRFIQQVQIHNEELEAEVQKGLDNAFKMLSEDGTIEKMIQDAVRKNIMDSFSRWIFQSDIRSKLEKQITEKLNKKIDAYTDSLVNEIAAKLNLPKE
jgi:hypothetical protein